MGGLKHAIRTAFSFIPQDPKFPDRLVEQSLLLQKAAGIFESITTDWSQLNEGARQLKELEHAADQFVHDVTIELRQVWLSDIDKEDPKLLTELIDDVIDHIEEAANRLVIFQISCPAPKLHEIAAHLVEVAGHIHKALALLQKNQWRGEEFTASYREIHTIENEGDKIHRAALPQLFNMEHFLDSIDSAVDDESVSTNRILKQILLYEKKRLLAEKLNIVYQDLEDAFDKAEDIAIALEHIRIKGGPRWKSSFF